MLKNKHPGPDWPGSLPLPPPFRPGVARVIVARLDS